MGHKTQIIEITGQKGKIYGPHGCIYACGIPVAVSL